MARNKNKAAAADKRATATVTTAPVESAIVPAPSTGTELATIETPQPVETEPTVEIIRSPAQVLRDCFTLSPDGETLERKPGCAITAVELAETLKAKAIGIQSASVQAAWLLHVAYTADDNGAMERRAMDRLDDGSVSKSTLDNLKSLARAIPFKIEHSIKSPLYVLKDALAAIRANDDTLKDTPEAVAVFKALADGTVTINGKEVATTQAAIRALRKGYDKKTGQAIPKALPAPAPAESASSEESGDESTEPTDSASAESDSSTDDAPEATAPAPATKTQPPVAESDKPITEAEKASAIAIASLDRVLEYVRAKSIIGAERESFVNRTKQLVTLLNLALA